jgi:hypothetical protein
MSISRTLFHKRRFFHAVVALSAFSMSITAKSQDNTKKVSICSTQKVNGDCVLVVDRRYPLTMPAVQMRDGNVLTVAVTNRLPFETLTLNPQSAQAIPGSDQLANFVSVGLPNLKGLIITTKLNTSSLGLSAHGLAEKGTETPDIKTVKANLLALNNMLQHANRLIGSFSDKATTINLQLQEILSVLPRPSEDNKKSVRDSGIPTDTPDPWTHYPDWRKYLLCELTGQCDDSNPVPSINGVHQEGMLLQYSLPGGPTDKVLPPDPTVFDNKAFDDLASETETTIKTLPSASDQEKYANELRTVRLQKAELATYNTAISGAMKDLGAFLVSIQGTEGSDSTAELQVLGRIRDPRHSSDVNSAGARLLGRQVVYSVDSVNQIGTFVTAVSSTSQKKSIATITVLYADPIFEMSAGGFFSTLPNRSFANQTLVTQNPGAPPAQGNVVITQTVTRPTIVPFVAANFRLGHDFLLGSRRSAGYFTGALGLNPYNALPEFGVGLSLSWRLLMFSALYHEGHDIRLTQGEYVGEVWCNASAASGNIPKCSGNPPSPSTERFWKGGFALGISVRVPTTFTSSK